MRGRALAGSVLILLFWAGQAGAVISFQVSCSVEDVCRTGGCGGGNRQIDPDERLYPSFEIWNTGDETLTSVHAEVFSGLSCSPVLSSDEDILEPNGLMSFRREWEPCYAAISCGDLLEVRLSIETDQGVFEEPCYYQVPQACHRCEGSVSLRLLDCELVRDRCETGGDGSGDGFLDPGEIAEVAVTVFNEGQNCAHTSTGRVESLTPDLTILSGQTVFGTVRVGTSVVGDPLIEARVGLAAEPGSVAPIRVLGTYWEPGGTWPQGFDQECGLPISPNPTLCPPRDPARDLRLSGTGGRLTFNWVPPDGATLFSVYEGTLPQQRWNPWNQEVMPGFCRLASASEAPSLPVTWDGGSVFYLVEAIYPDGSTSLGSADLDGDGFAETARTGSSAPDCP